MSENTHLAEQEESATRIAELSAALETLRDNHEADMTALWRELDAAQTQLKAASARADRYLTHLQNGVEL